MHAGLVTSVQKTKRRMTVDVFVGTHVQLNVPAEAA
jgi:hypothetical protein